ncbi:sulfotransferase family protein [Nonomuraea thailandensis]|uniref:sulfotransferase family protein n=1 Tax=Nonomuraea thailandensis TaxID=1188745 RepID=UPI0020A46582|nr:sulfotransferase family protein [Nonomuraea thailandensis]
MIGAGLPRTGTLSLKAALERLGFGRCHHMFELFDHPELIGRWLPAAPADRAGWERVLAGYRSAIDWPVSFYWRELAAVFPEAKVVLTVRDPARWYASFRAMVGRRAAAIAAARGGGDAFEEAFAPLLPLLRHIACATFDGVRPGPDWVPDEARAVAGFARHAAAVQEGLPAERLLVFDVCQGWGPLCAFLGVRPPREPFPRLNDGDAVRHKLDSLRTAGRTRAGRDDAGWTDGR